MMSCLQINLSYPLLHDDCTSNSCDKKDVCDDSSIIYMPQLEHKLEIVSSNHVNCAEIRTFNPITSVHEELKLLSSLNTLGYIEFDVLCNLNNLEEKLSFSADLPWLSKHAYYVIGRHNWKGEYMVHQVYICSNMKSSFVIKQHDRLECCVKANHMSSSTCSSLYVLQ
jgi:predicted transcriptional regulator